MSAGSPDNLSCAKITSQSNGRNTFVKNVKSTFSHIFNIYYVIETVVKVEAEKSQGYLQFITYSNAFSTTVRWKTPNVQILIYILV